MANMWGGGCCAAAAAAWCKLAAASNFSFWMSSSLFFRCFLSFALRFWNQIFTWKRKEKAKVFISFDLFALKLCFVYYCVHFLIRIFFFIFACR